MLLKGMKQKLALLVISIVVGGLLGVSLAIERERPTPNNIFWVVSGHQDSNGNVSYSVILRGVNFTFLYRDKPPMDAPIIVYFRVDFLDGTTEYLMNTIGGLTTAGARIVMSDHVFPQAAIVSKYATSNEEWYGWYYAVSRL